MSDSRRVQLKEDLSFVEFETSENVEVISSFQSMGLKEDLLRGIYAYGMFFIILNIMLLYLRLFSITTATNL